MDFDEFYGRHYRNKNESALVGLNHQLSHRFLERNVRGHFANVIELGAGSGEHIPFVKHSFDSYLMTDIRDMQDFTLSDDRVHFEKMDIRVIAKESESFDRIICTCVLQHIANPRDSLIEIRRIAKPNALVTLNVACDPGITYELLWNLTSGKRLRKEGVSFPKSIHYQEHVTHFTAVKSFIQEIFHNDFVKYSFYPTRLPFHNLNIFAAYQINVRK